jgi:sterol 14-demethylase
MQVESIFQRAMSFGRREPVPTGLREPPKLEGGLPVLGHTVPFVRSAIDLLDRAHRELGEVASFQIAHKRIVAMFGPEAHEAVFRAPDEQLNPSEAYKIMTPVFGKDIIYDAPPDKMSEQFKMLLPALKDKRMRTYGETIVAEVEKSIEGWGDEGEFDIVDYCRVLTNFTSSACLLGHEFRSGMTDEFARVYHDLERGITPVAYLNAHLPIPSFRKRDQARARLVEMITEIIQNRRKSGREGEDFLQTLMDAKYKSGLSLNEHEITGMLLAAMFAGHHTSSVTTAWALIELVRNREWLHTCRDQLDQVFGDGTEVGFNSLREINLTEYAVKETLRLHPPLFMLVRTAMKDFVYKDYFIPAGTWVVVSPTVAHTIPGVFEDPLRFDPSRFAPPREEDKKDFAYIPFGGGRHKCMGNAFALLQVKAILAILLRRYDFELATANIGSDFHGLVVGPTEPCRLRYRRRRDAAAHTATNGKAHARTNGSTAAAAKTAASGCPFDHAEVAPSTKPFKVVADLDLCQSHAVCMGEAPEVFQANGVDKVVLLAERPDVALRTKIQTAVEHCPTRALKIVED